MQKITPFLWFNGDAEAAVNFYVSIFENSHVVKLVRYPDGAPAPKGTVMTAQFVLDGQEFVALNGGPQFTFSPAISFVVNCETQDEVDEYWERLSVGGEKRQCGWLQDKYGISWQVVPRILGKLLGDADGMRAQRVMAAMLAMTKIDLEILKRASEGT
jgi:predicted 3-demethylubiquinone-9 3-methyltransferase (glyoxalase superfamily)